MLAHTLLAFSARGVNLTALQSRPEPSAPWTYRFYVDVEGAAHEPRVAEALEEVEALAAQLIILGSYEAWTEGVPSFQVPPPDAGASRAEAGHPAGRPPPPPRGHDRAGAARGVRRRRRRC